MKSKKFTNESIREMADKSDKIFVHSNKRPLKLSYRTYERICQLAGVSVYEGLEFGNFPTDEFVPTPFGKEDAKEQPKKEKDKKKRMIVNLFKEEVLEAIKGKGGLINTNVLGSIIFMKTLYTLLIVLGICVLTFLLIHIYQDYLALEQGEFITICFISLCFLSGGMGISKLSKKSVICFRKINLLLFNLIINAAFFIGMRYCHYLSGNRIEKYCQTHFILMVIFTIAGVVLALMLMILNKSLKSFYGRYFEEEEKKVLISHQEVEMGHKDSEEKLD